MQFAMDLLHERLNEKAGGKLPKIEEDARCLLTRFDEDHNGRLDREEFGRFARVYFSRLEWPLWRVAAKGFGVGCVAFAVAELALAPIGRAIAGVVIPRLIAKVRKEFGAAMSEKMKVKLEKLRARFGDGNPLTQSEREAADVRRIERREALERRAKKVRKVAGFGAMGAAATVAGLV
jgi:hypothetical protein